MVTYELRVDFDHEQVRGNASASGDDILDKEIEDEILERMEQGDVWAWAQVEVIARLEIGNELFTGHDWLGCCTYADEEEFCEPGGYYDDMCKEALNALRGELANAIDRGLVADKAITQIF